MGMFDNNLRQAIEICIERRTPFCLYSLPLSDSSPVFFANPSRQPVPGKRRFFIGKWNESSDNFLYIDEEMNESEIIKSSPTESSSTRNAEESFKSSSKEQYIENLTLLIKDIRNKDAEKVVFSRTADFIHPFHSDDIIELAEKVFFEYTYAFRFLYLTPETGMWIGATPELLVDFNQTDQTVKTYAIAGTRPSGQSSEWSKKNIDEQLYVISHIRNCLKELEVNIVEGPTTTLHAGTIEHIATPFTGTFKSLKPKNYGYHVIDVLNPTPALCGHPKEPALQLIEKYETHKRDCYGGVIGVDDRNSIICFVNLRCARLMPDGAVLYAGGGILAESDAEDEWNETERKLTTIGRFINP